MSFIEVLDLDCDTAIALGGFNKKTRKDNPTQVEGWYVGTKETPSKLSKTGFSALHILQLPNGGRIGVWGKTDLDRKIKNVPPGAMIRATFTGTAPTKYGEMAKFKVEVDKSNTIEVDNVAGSKEAADVDASRNYDSDESYDDDLVAVEEQVLLPPKKPAQPARSPDATLRSQTEELLRNKVRS